MKSNQSFNLLRTIALSILFIGALVSLYFVINAGRNNNSLLLNGLFIIWVFLPYAALLIAHSISKRWTFLVRKAIFWTMIIVSIVSLLLYSGAFNILQTKKTFVFLIVPFSSLLFSIAVILTTQRLKSKASNNSLNSNINSYKMEKLKLPLIKLLTIGALAGNILFILWVTYNGIDEGFKGTLPEKISYITLMGLLTTNVFLILRRRTTIN